MSFCVFIIRMNKRNEKAAQMKARGKKQKDETKAKTTDFSFVQTFISNLYQIIHEVLNLITNKMYCWIKVDSFFYRFWKVDTADGEMRNIMDLINQYMNHFEVQCQTCLI